MGMPMSLRHSMPHLEVVTSCLAQAVDLATLLLICTLLHLLPGADKILCILRRHNVLHNDVEQAMLLLAVMLLI